MSGPEVTLDGHATRSDAMTEATADVGDVLEEKIVTFPDGLPGLPEYERFVLVEVVAEGVFQRLQSIDDPDVAMYVCVPWLFFPDYAPELSTTEQEDLSIERPEDALVFCPVTLDPDAHRVYVNLLGPFVVNAATRRGRQLVLAGSDYPTRAPIQLEEG